MLSPEERSLFVNAIRPPDGYQFDRGVGTTFTLDLLTLLVTPLSLALYDCADIDDALQDPLALLEGLRRYADRLSIFCQSGFISVPRSEHYLYRYLEDIIVEVQAPKGGVFHPKVWLLRYISNDSPIIYRLLNLSRNLTFDKSWDLILNLEGELTNRKVGFSRNSPLSHFIRVLPELALRSVNDRIAQDIDLLQEEVRKVDFKLNYPFQGFPEFYPSGIPGFRSYRFNNPIYRMMIISPFLTRSFLGTISQRGENHVLVSTINSIDSLSPQIRNRFDQLYVLDDLADRDPEGDIKSTDDGTENIAKWNNDLTGLHAKLFILEERWDATWLIGSANATDAAFRGHNVEFMIALNGRKSQVGIDKVIENESDLSLRSLLKPYPKTKSKLVVDSAKTKVEKIAEEVRKWLIGLKIYIDIIEEDNGKFDLIIKRMENLSQPEGNYLIDCWPISLPSNFSQLTDHETLKVGIFFRKLSIITITPFIAFRVTAHDDTVEHMINFVLNLRIMNIPDGRDDYILGEVISNQHQFVRYLRLLLAGESEYANLIERPQLLNVTSNASSMWEDMDLPLLEDLLRALSQSPEKKIDRIAEVVAQLKKTPHYQKIIPEKFDELWETIIKARETMR
jgi:hypothetical protein